METRKMLGIDIGTTSICIAGREEGKETLSLVLSAKNAFLPGTYEQDPEKIVEQVKELLVEAERKGFGPEELSAIGISSQMHGVLYVDASGKAVSPLYTWKDEKGRELMPGTDETYEAYLSRTAGYRLYSGYGTVTHFYLDRNGRIPEGAVKLAGIGDYLAMCLAGRTEPLLDVSMAAGIGGFDLEKGDFDRERLEMAGVKTSFYPKLHIYGEGAGVWRGVPVSCSYGDNQASFCCAVDRPEEQISINVGTGSQVSVYSDRLFTDISADISVDIRPFFGKGYLYVGASLNGGKVYERLAAFFEETVLAFTGQKVDAYQVLPRLAKEAAPGEKGMKDPDARALSVDPALYGTRGTEAAGGSITGMTPENFRPGSLVQAYVRGMAEELYRMYLAFPEEIRAGRRQIVASGNGIRKNELLADAVEERFGCPVCFGEIEEEAAAGAALAAYRELTEGRFVCQE